MPETNPPTETKTQDGHDHAVVHTPGPWKIVRVGSTMIIVVEDQFEVCRLIQGALYSSPSDVLEMEINAKLISKLPEMLKVVKVVATGTGDTDLEDVQDLSKDIMERLTVA